VLFYNFNQNKVETMRESVVKKRFIIDLGLNLWFFTEHTVATLAFDPEQPRIYFKNGSLFCNLYEGCRRDFLPFTSYTDEVQEAVNFIFNHFRNVLCSNDLNQFEYLVRWLANAAIAKRNGTAIFLCSLQGSGKSISVDFLTEKVFGKKLSFTTSKLCTITGQFNGELECKTLLVLNEMRRRSGFNIYDRLKDIITDATLVIHKKYGQPYEIMNTLNTIVVTNHMDALQSERDDRRMTALDVTNEKVGDFGYFSELLQKMNLDLVSDAFFSRLVSLVDPNFDSRKIPKATIRTEQLIASLDSVMRFLKESFVLKNRGIMMSIEGFYENYKVFSTNHHLKLELKNAVGKTLDDFGIPKTRRAGGQWFRILSRVELHHLFEKANLLHATDEFEDSLEDESFLLRALALGDNDNMHS